MIWPSALLSYLLDSVEETTKTTTAATTAKRTSQILLAQMRRKYPF